MTASRLCALVLLATALPATAGPFDVGPEFHVDSAGVRVTGWMVADNFSQLDHSLFSPLYKPYVAVVLNCARGSRECGLTFLIGETAEPSFFLSDFATYEVVQWQDFRVVLKRELPCARDFWTIDSGERGTARFERVTKAAAEQKSKACDDPPRTWRTHVGSAEELRNQFRKRK